MNFIFVLCDKDNNIISTEPGLDYNLPELGTAVRLKSREDLYLVLRTLSVYETNGEISQRFVYIKKSKDENFYPIPKL